MVKKKTPPGLWSQPADPTASVLSELENVSDEEWTRNIETAEKEREQYNLELRARAKTEEQLTVGLECTVVDIHSYQSSTSFTPSSEIVLGGRSPTYGGGHVYRTEMKVESGTLVEKLEFAGWPPLEVGDSIKAYVMKGKPEPEKHSLGSFCNDSFDQEPKTHLVERDYQATEQPSKIEKLRNGKVVATYHNR